MTTADKYRAAGVDLDAADQAKQRIRAAVTSTHTPLTMGGFGSFGGIVRLPDDVDRPALVMSTDGVGTKVLVAIAAGRHDTVGEDLVNHSVNDILVHAARPLAFLDYIAGSLLDVETIAALVDGVARGCRMHDLTLAGGETAQMPDIYHPGHYDLAGTIVGVVSADAALQGDRVRPGDQLVGYASSGLHTNGYTLVRRILFEELGLEIDSDIPGVGATVGEELLKVHRSYWSAISPVIAEVNALAHITGGGIAGNLSRPLPEGCGARVERSAWEVPPIFQVLQDAGGVDAAEMLRVFNMGLGMIAVVPSAGVEPVRRQAESVGVKTWMVGEIARGEGVVIAG